MLSYISQLFSAYLCMHGIVSWVFQQKNNTPSSIVAGEFYHFLIKNVGLENRIGFEMEVKNWFQIGDQRAKVQQILALISN